MNPYKRDRDGLPRMSIKIVANLIARRADSAVNQLQVGISSVLFGSRRRYSVTLMPLMDGRPDGALVYDVGVQQFVEAYHAYLLLTEFLRRSQTRLNPHEFRDYIRASHLAMTNDKANDGDERTAAAMHRFRQLISPKSYGHIKAVSRNDINPELLAIVRRADLR